MSEDRPPSSVVPQRRPEERVFALLDARDPAAAVEALPISDLYHLVKDLGLDDAHELVALASPDQIQGLLDLDVWKGDQVDSLAVRPWLEALIAAGYEKLVSVWRQLDPDLTALIFQRWIRVYDIIEDEVPDWEEPPLIATPDRFFVLKVTSEDPEIQRTFELFVDRLYRGDPELARHTIRSASSEPTAHLEETALRWRTGRIMDLGFAPLDEALVVYQPIDVASVTIGAQAPEPAQTPVTLPAIYAEPLRKHFLGRVLARLESSPGETTRLEAALAMLLNRVLSANRVDPSDYVAAAAAAAAGTATLSLGLETVARGDLARGEEALRQIPLTKLHRVGHTVTLSLSRLARVLAPRAGRAGEPGTSILTALLSPRPRLSRALDSPPDLGVRPFASVVEIRTAAHALGVLAAEVSMVRDALGVDPQAIGPATTLGDIGRTALARALFGRGLSFAPVSPEDVRRFAASLDNGHLPEAARAAARQAFLDLLAEKKIGAVQEFEAAISGWISDLENELGSLATDMTPDRRFVAGLVLE